MYSCRSFRSRSQIVDRRYDTVDSDHVQFSEAFVFEFVSSTVKFKLIMGVHFDLCMKKKGNRLKFRGREGKREDIEYFTIMRVRDLCVENKLKRTKTGDQQDINKTSSTTNSSTSFN